MKRPSSAASDRTFIGREREMAVLKEALSHALEGQGQMALLAGEPGIGKTRTAQELAAHAAARGGLALWGWCYEEEGAPPYWPWVQPLRTYIRQQDPEELRKVMSRNATEVAEIIPELREIVPGLSPPPTLEPEQARFRLFDSIATFLKNAAQFQPLVIVLEDLHWADRSSLLLLEFIAHEVMRSQLLLVGTYRDVELTRRHPLHHALGNLVREAVCQRVELGGLTPQEMKDFVEVTAGVSPTPALMRTIYQRTEGNPLFVGELVSLLRQEGMENEQSLSAHIPEGVRAAIGRRLNRLSEGCNQLLTTASVIGREFDFRLLAALNDAANEEPLLQLVDEALEARLIEELPGGKDRYQFSHALVQETLLGELSPSRRVRLHARIAWALEEIYGPQAEAHAAELAYHFGQAEPAAGPAKLLSYARLAGRQALAAHAYEDALHHFERALAVKQGQPMDAELADLVLSRGLAQAASFGRDRFQEALDDLLRAFDYYVAAGESRRAIAIAAHPFEFWTEQHPGVARLVEQGLRLTTPDSYEAGRLLSSYGRMQGIDRGDYQAAQETFVRALSIAHEHQDAALEMRTLAWSAIVDLFHLHLLEGLRKSQRAIGLARIADDPRIEVAVGFWASFIMIIIGDLQQAEAAAKRSLAIAERARSSQTLAAALLGNVLVAQSRGDWETARSLSDRGLALWSMDPRFLSARMILECQLGNFTHSEACANNLLQVMRLAASGPNIEHATPAMAIAFACRIRQMPEGLEAARAAAETVISSSRATPFMALMSRVGLALLASQRGDAHEAEHHYSLLEPVSRGIMLFGLSGDCLLGVLSRASGSPDYAAAHFEHALDFCRRGGYQPALAWTCCEYAELLEHHGPDTRGDKAAALLREALAISRELGMNPLTARASALLQRLTSRGAKATAFPDGLSQREVEVLRLVALGKTNRQIAAELSISLHTVANHVQNILNKTGSANRAEAAAYASRQGLM